MEHYSSFSVLSNRPYCMFPFLWECVLWGAPKEEKQENISSLWRCIVSFWMLHLCRKHTHPTLPHPTGCRLNLALNSEETHDWGGDEKLREYRKGALIISSCLSFHLLVVSAVPGLEPFLPQAERSSQICGPKCALVSSNFRLNPHLLPEDSM